jgi:hypothetical protein
MAMVGLPAMARAAPSDGSVAGFVPYGGTSTVAGGPANGTSTTDTGASQSGSETEYRRDPS